MKTYNFGIIGAGLIADFHAKVISDIPQARLLGVWDKIPAQAEKKAKNYGCRFFNNLEELLQEGDLDIVTIATPSGAHMEPAVAAAKAGKHVICEKPLEINLERIDAMLEAHKKSGTLLGGVFQNRFNDAITPLRAAIQADRFGKITYAGIYVPWWRKEEYYKDSWHGTLALDGGGALMNQAIHMIDLLIYLMPPIQAIQAFSGTLGHEHMETEDTAVAALRFQSGALGIIYGTTASYPGQLRRLEITGTKGTVVYLEDSFTVWQFAEEKAEDKGIREKYGQASTLGGAADPAAISYQNHKKNFMAFIDALEKGTEFCLSGGEARKAVEVILAIYKAAREEKIVKI